MQHISLFQKSVEKKYLNDLDTDLINNKYNQFREYFGNPVRQENIRNSKEEQFQEGFLRELFVKILDYTLNPEPNFNLTTELKNTDNSKKADGAILKGEDAMTVIEPKSTNTTDLESIETQASGYKNHHPKCKYVITSNFEKIRFYIQNAVEHIDFNLFNLTNDQFALLWLCLHKDNLLSDLPQKIKSVAENVQVLSLNLKNYHNDFLTEVLLNKYKYPTSNFGENEWSIQPQHDANLLDKIKDNGTPLKKLPISIYRGILTGYNDAFYIDETTRQQLLASDSKSKELIKPIVRGRDISAFGITGFEYLISTFPTLKLNIEDYPSIKEHLLTFGDDRLKQTGEKGSRKKTKGQWFETQDSIAYYQEFSKPKIIYPNMTSEFPFSYNEDGILGKDKSFILTANNDSISLKFLAAIFNSTLTKKWIWYNCPELQGGTREIRKVYFEHFPVPSATIEQIAQLSLFTSNQTQRSTELQKLSEKFKRTLQSKFETLDNLTQKLENWYQLTFLDFVKELKKKKVKLSLSEEAEREDYFIAEQQKAQALQTQINKTNKKIDQMVYQLYGLSDDEIAIVENNSL